MIESTGLLVTPCLCSVKSFVVVLLFAFLGSFLGADEERKSVRLGRGSGAAVPAEELGVWKLRLHSAEWVSVALHRDVLTPELLRRLACGVHAVCIPGSALKMKQSRT